MKLRAALIAALALFCLAKAPANAACGTIPYVFTNAVSIVDATTTNANNAFLIGCASNVDNTQIGTAGIFASQIIPGSTGQATFGGSQSYTFNYGLTVNGALLTINALPVVNGQVQINWNPSATALFIQPSSDGSQPFENFYSHTAVPLFRVQEVNSTNATVSVAQGGTLGYVGPAYATSGSSVASTWHEVFSSALSFGSSGCAPQSDCQDQTISWSSAPHFTSSTSFGCWANSLATSHGYAFTFSGPTTTSVVASMWNISSAVVSDASVPVVINCKGT